MIALFLQKYSFVLIYISLGRVPALQRTRSNACVSCGADADSYCSRCGVTPYCSTRCQARDWAGRHRAVCHNLARIAGEQDIRAAVAEVQQEVHNPAPLRRPRVYEEESSRRQRRDDDTVTKVSDKSNKSDQFRRLQDRARTDAPRQPYHKKDSAPGHNNTNQPHRNNNQYYKNNQRFHKPQPVSQKPAVGASSTMTAVDPFPTKTAVAPPPTKTEVKPETNTPAPEKQPAPVSLPNPQINGATKPVPAVVKPASLGDVTPTKKLVPKNYLIEQLAIGDTVLLSVDAKAADCKSPKGDYVCLSMHEKYEADYQTLLEDYVLECDADSEPYKPAPGDACSYFNVDDGAWYRARCLGAGRLALLDACRLLALLPTDKIRNLPDKYGLVPEFCCVLQAPNVEIGANLKCLLVAKSGDGYKVTMENVETGAAAGEGVVYRWLPTVEYLATKPVIPEIPRPDLKNNSRVLLVDATALERAFVRPAEPELQRQYDDVIQSVLLAGRQASPLKEPPTKGQTVIAKFSDGLHYRALCRRTNVTQNKYLLEYVEYGNVEVCRNIEDMFPCPPNLDLSAIPAQVSMIKLSSEEGPLTTPALEYIEKLKDNDELILTLPNGETSAPSGSEANLKLVKTGECVNKKIVEMCTPEWKKFQEKGGDVVDVAPLMYSDLEHLELPAGPAELIVLDISALEGGFVSGYVATDTRVNYVFNELEQKMAAYCNSELGKEPYLPMIEELCITQRPPTSQWSRAVLIEQVNGPGGSEARVCFLDYGDIAVVPVSALRKMLPDFVRGVPVVAVHLEIKDFPSPATAEQVRRAAALLQCDGAGRGRLRALRLARQEPGMYLVHAPQFIKHLLDD